MQAAVIRTFGDPGVLKYEEIATPKPKPKHILIKVLAAGVNRFDHYIREGSVVPELPFPHILGADAVGEVAELGGAGALGVAHLAEGLNQSRLAERFGRTRETIATCLKGQEFDALQQTLQEETRRKIQRKLHGAADRAGNAWIKSLDPASAKSGLGQRGPSTRQGSAPAWEVHRSAQAG